MRALDFDDGHFSILGLEVVPKFSALLFWPFLAHMGPLFNFFLYVFYNSTKTSANSCGAHVYDFRI